MRVTHPRSNPAHSFMCSSTHAFISKQAIRVLQSYSFKFIFNLRYPRSAHCSHFPLIQNRQPAVRRTVYQLLYISFLRGPHIEVPRIPILSAVCSIRDIVTLTRSSLGSLLLEHRRLSSVTAGNGVRTIIMPVPRGTSSSLVPFSLIVIIGNRFLALFIGSHLCCSREWVSSVITRCGRYQLACAPQGGGRGFTIFTRPSFVVTSLSWVDSTTLISLCSTPLSLGTVLSWNTRIVRLSLPLSLALELLSITAFS